jgi:hypothetical protein
MQHADRAGSDWTRYAASIQASPKNPECATNRVASVVVEVVSERLVTEEPVALPLAQ